MTKKDFISNIEEVAPGIVITDHNGYLHLSEPVKMLCYNPKTPFTEQMVIAYNNGFVRTLRGDFDFCLPPNKRTTRFLTPAECAGKWLVQLNDRHRSLVIFFDESSIKTAAMHGMIETLHSTGWKIADTPTSTPYSLEVEIANQ